MGDRCYDHRTRCCVSCKEAGQEKVRPNPNTLTDAEREEVEAGLRMDNDLWRDGTTDLYSTVFRDAAIERILTARLAAVMAERERLGMELAHLRRVLISVENLAERGERKGYDIDPCEVLDILRGEGS